MTAPRAGDALDAGAFRAGDEAALADLYARWSPLVYSLALRSLGDVATAEQVTRRVFREAWRSGEPTDRAQTRGDWLVGLTHDSITVARDAPGRRSTTPGGTSIDYSAGSESKTGVLAERLLVADDLSRLGALTQRMLRMALDQRLPLAEIAERTGLRVEEVRSEVVRGLMELRPGMKEDQADAH